MLAITQLLFSQAAIINLYHTPTTSFNSWSHHRHRRQHPAQCNRSMHPVLHAAKGESNKEIDRTTIFTHDNDQKWIVIVDDEKPIRQALGEYLSENGFEVTACSNVDTAIKVCESNIFTNENNDEIKLPDCIISDIRMPGKDGIEFLTMLRSHQQLQAVPAILLTAKGMTADRIQGYQAGADAYLTKPFHPDELLAIIDMCIERREFLGNQISTEELQDELNDIKYSLLEKGGAGVGDGWVKNTGAVLTLTEQRLLSHLSEGLLNREIAQRMGLSTRTIEGHLTVLYRKAKVSNRTKLVRWAVDTGYVEM